MLPLFARAQTFNNRIAIQCNQENYTYIQLLDASEKLALALLQGNSDLNEARIAFLAPPGFAYVCMQWGIWRAGGIAVPLCEKHPLPSMEYVIEDTTAHTILCTPEFEDMLAPLQKHCPLLLFESLQSESGTLPDLNPERRAMILYTSGTTGLPKGVVTTHANIEAQITALTASWEWEANDHVLNILPLHHVHGIINMLGCALWSGACCEFLPKFDPDVVFDRFTSGDVNLFMAVPTIYFKLIARYNELSDSDQDRISKALKNFRLMVSGSAALPVSVLEQWREISGHTLLERYGMTEMGMAISNPYRGERKPGYIGQALPGVQIRLADESGQIVPENTPGEIQVKGPNVFSEYWGKPGETVKAFTEDGWFLTGDIAVLESGSYRILGRNSVDIIKSGGYKISALEIEEVLRTHPGVKDCAIIGIPDDEWGEVVAAGVVPGNVPLNVEEIQNWLKSQMPAYKIPRQFIELEELPRNVLGKVTKNALKDLIIKS
jgi:malonyl-CoA/methylmalonyl-CoA synthetase